MVIVESYVHKSQYVGFYSVGMLFVRYIDDNIPYYLSYMASKNLTLRGFVEIYFNIKMLVIYHFTSTKSKL